jgi:hypothetical protein
VTITGRDLKVGHEVSKELGVRYSNNNLLFLLCLCIDTYIESNFYINL